MTIRLHNEDNRLSYSQWVRWAIGLGHGGNTIKLFDSSVPEPQELLRTTIAQLVTPDFSSFYTSAFWGGNPHNLDVLANWYGATREQVLCTTGATSALSLLYRTFTRPGDHILIESPGFDLFEELAQSLSITAESFTRSGDLYEIDYDEIEKLIKPTTKLLVLSNLHNPSGMSVDYTLLKRLGDLAEARGFLIVVDEVYGDYASKEQRPYPAYQISKSIISISSLTKIFGLASLRCGWMVGDTDVINEVKDISARIEFGISTLSHAVAAHVFDNVQPFFDYSADIMSQSRPVMDAWFAGMLEEGAISGALPKSGCICFPRLVGIEDTESFAAWLIRRGGPIVVPGEFFAEAGRVRIGFGMPAEILRQGLDALADGMRDYRAEHNITQPSSQQKAV